MAIGYNYLAKFGSSGSSSGKFNFTGSSINGFSNCGIAVDSTRIFVVDTGNNRIQVFNRNTYAFIAQFGTIGSGNGQFNAPRAIHIDGTYIYILDGLNNRIQKFNISNYNYVAQISIGSYTWTALTGDSTYLYVSGTINTSTPIHYKVTKTTLVLTSLTNYKTYISDWVVGVGSSYIYSCFNYSVTPKQATRSNLPYTTETLLPNSNVISNGITLDSNYIYISEKTTNQIKSYDLSLLTYINSYGSYGTGVGQFINPGRITYHDNKLYIVDTGNSRIQIIGVAINESFPDINPSYSVIESVSFNTKILDYGNNVEQRIAFEALGSKSFKIQWDVLSQTEKQSLQDFFIYCLGSYKTFEWTNLLNNITYTVKFKEDIMNAEYFNYLLWSVKQVELVEVV